MNAAQEHHLVREIIDDGTGRREVPDHSAEMLQRTSSTQIPAKITHWRREVAIEEKNVRRVRIKGGRQVNQQEAHLVDVAAEMLAGEPVAEFVDCTDHQKQNPESPHIVGALVGEGIQARTVSRWTRLQSPATNTQR